MFASLFSVVSLASLSLKRRPPAVKSCLWARWQRLAPCIAAQTGCRIRLRIPSRPDQFRSVRLIDSGIPNIDEIGPRSYRPNLCAGSFAEIPNHEPYVLCILAERV